MQEELSNAMSMIQAIASKQEEMQQKNWTASTGESEREISPKKLKPSEVSDQNTD